MAHNWQSDEYVDDWVTNDSQSQLLNLPMKIGAQLAHTHAYPVTLIVDLGSGPGTFLKVLLDTFPQAEGVWVDSSSRMAELARENLAEFDSRVSYLFADASRPQALTLESADIVATARMVHHFGSADTRAFYQWARTVIGRHGFLLNLDHYASPPEWHDHYRTVRQRLLPRSTSERRRHEHQHSFKSIDQHLTWIVNAGFQNADVAWKAFNTALLVGRLGEHTIADDQ